MLNQPVGRSARVRRSMQKKQVSWFGKLVSSGLSLVVGTIALLLLSATYSIIYNIVNTTLSDLIEHSGAPKYSILWTSFMLIYGSFLLSTFLWIRLTGDKNTRRGATPENVLVSLVK
jgi:hypothetical protein